VATASTPLAFLETVMVKGYQSLVDEDNSVSLRDAMEAALKLNEIARKDEGLPAPLWDASAWGAYYSVSRVEP
jgi:hypothetical protein